MSAGKVLVVEDDKPLQEALVSTLQAAGYEVRSAGDGKEALKIVDVERFDLVVTDVQMKPLDGCQLLRQLKLDRPDLPVLMMTAHGTIEQAVAAMQQGAADYLVKPFEASELQDHVSRHVRQTLPGARVAVEVIACDPRTRAVLNLARKVAATEVTVLLTGDSGTGKEVFARYIHRSSARADADFVAVNCAAIPDQMLEAMLFGHEKGAFTGAQSSSKGKFLQAQGGTLLLDEVTEMPIGLQAKLPRVLQEREVEPLGATKPIPVDVRVLATSNRDLDLAVKNGDLREDLYYRLSVFPVEIPKLCERPGDIEPLTDHFLSHQSVRAIEVSAAARAALAAHTWPGNVRELQNVIQRALVLAQGEPRIETCHLILDPSAAIDAAARSCGTGGLASDLWDEEARRIIAALDSSNGNRKRAAAQLSVSARTLRYKLAKIRDAGWAVPGDRAH